MKRTQAIPLDKSSIEEITMRWLIYVPDLSNMNIVLSARFVTTSFYANW